MNSVITQLFANAFPSLAAAFNTVSVNGVRADGSLVHLHWLVIVGMMSFIASVLQLIPLDNSAGSKLSGVIL